MPSYLLVHVTYCLQIVRSAREPLIILVQKQFHDVFLDIACFMKYVQALHDKTEQNKRKQNKVEPNRTKPNHTKQS